MTKPTKKILVWVCACGHYELDFKLDNIYCRRCGNNMTPKIYVNQEELGKND